MQRIVLAVIVAGCLVALTCLRSTWAQDSESRQSNLDYWLSQAKPATTSQPETQPVSHPTHRPDALPGMVELSDGTLLRGWMHTTPGKPWLVYVEQEKRWRRVPFAAALSIRAQVTEEKMEMQWRWKGMGEPERVYTGKTYPTQRFLWELLLADGSTLTGTIKGQPLWIQTQNGRHGPFVLHERNKGKVGTNLSDLVYVRRIIVSKRLIEPPATSQSK